MFNKLAQFKSRLIPVSAGILIPISLIASATNAGQLQGKGYFEHAPRLVRSAVSTDAARTPATYQFTVNVPQDAGAALQAVKIVQERNLDTVSLNPNQSHAFLGNSFAGGTPVTLSAIGGTSPEDSHEVTVEFNPPIAPGLTVTVSLDVNRNPQMGGIYQFGVTAYPVGDSRGLFLGVGRVSIYDH